MSNELILTTSADATVYTVILNETGQVWQTTTATFVTVVDANWANYDVPMVEQGTSTGIYYGDFPTGITTAGVYNVFGYTRLTGTPLVTDTLVGEGQVFWDGTAASSTPTGYDLTTLANVRAYMGISSTTYDVTLASLISQASAAISIYCDQVLVEQSVTEVHDIFAPRSFLKLRNTINPSITAITFDKYETNESVIPPTEFYVSDYGTVRFKPSSTYGRNFDGIISVTYTAGYSTIPADLTLACNMLVKSLFDMRSKDYGVKKESIGDYSYELGGALTGDLSAGIFAPITALLDNVYTDEAINCW